MQPIRFVLSTLLLASVMATPRAQAQDTIPAAQAPTALAPDQLTTLRRDIVGMWTEYNPSNNEVDFNADGSVRLYLEPGEVGALASLDGTWALQPDGKLLLHFEVKGLPLDVRPDVRMEHGELVLQDGSKITRHRRRTGPLPARFKR